ncbi:hypothetical protein BKA57DRAFT_148814 [Linnemannia elongata]|nr:hypothetical protein BKA57DRAFT_148814 [Linnemannia elongata]
MQSRLCARNLRTTLLSRKFITFRSTLVWARTKRVCPWMLLFHFGCSCCQIVSQDSKCGAISFRTSTAVPYRRTPGSCCWTLLTRSMPSSQTTTMRVPGLFLLMTLLNTVARHWIRTNFGDAGPDLKAPYCFLVRRSISLPLSSKCLRFAPLLQHTSTYTRKNIKNTIQHISTS